MGGLAKMPLLALVTGGTGFLGRHVVESLLSQDFSVRIISRREIKTRERVEHVKADLVADELDACFDGVDILIHLASAMTGSEREMHSANVIGTARLLDAMKRSSCSNIVYSSSLSVYDWNAATRILETAGPLLNAGTGPLAGVYADTKRQQESAIRDRARAEGWTLTVIRPGAIWGLDFWPDYAIGPTLGPFQLVINPAGVPRLVFVRNLAQCFASAASREDPAGEVILNVVDDPGPTRWTLAVRARRGRFRVLLPVPLSMAETAVRYLSFAMDQRKLPYFLKTQIFKSLYTNLPIERPDLTTSIGMPASASFEAGVAEGPPA